MASAAPAGVTGRNHRPVWAAVVFAVVLGVLWARFWASASGDLAAQLAWAGFAADHPGSAYDLAWYGGMSPASYSLLAPYLMAVLGVRGAALAALAVAASLLAVLAVRAPVRHPTLLALWGALALVCNVAAGRVSFALGIAFALAALVAATAEGSAGWWRVAGCATAALLATVASPLAGLFLEVVAAALLLTRRWRTGWALALPPPLTVVATTLLFPSSGVDPITVSTVAFTLASALAVGWLCPRSWRTVRIGSAVYAVGAALCWMVPTPIGGNVGRLALVFASVVLLAVLLRAAPAGAQQSRRRTVALLVAFAACGYWLIAADLVGLPAPSPPREAGPLVAELRQLHADQARLEAVPMLNHGEAWDLVGSAVLARGWNRQLDVQRNPLFYTATLSAADYHAWLRRWAVRYVVLPTAPLDPAADTESAVIESHPGWLSEVWRNPHWQLFRVADPLPLGDPPARVQHAGVADLEVALPAAATVRLRVAWSPWLAVSGPASACLAQDGAWTSLRASGAGVYRLTAPYAWPRGAPCPHR
ncbi:hypothetical protein ABIA32_003220 [Streptacidiphilus sp. MAP12-20]|uniref:MFS transporter n=1 Tax=Streptacidiphilus sp. MAP12-20 TaxID=3156299 RepID=UPI003512CB70